MDKRRIQFLYKAPKKTEKRVVRLSFPFFHEGEIVWMVFLSEIYNTLYLCSGYVRNRKIL